MKKKITLLIGVLSILGVCLFIYSCAKKEVNTDANVGAFSAVPDNLLQAARDYETQQTQNPTTLSINTGIKRSILQPNWKEASMQILNNGSKQIIVSSPVVSLDPKSKQGVVRKFVYSTANNQITGGKIIEMFASADYMLSNKSNLIEKYTNGDVGGYTGVAISYDLKYNYLGSDVYKNGVKQRAVGSVLGDHNSQLKIKNTGAITTLDDCESYYLTLTYWDENGIPFDQEIYYLYTICVQNGDVGNEYGGNPGSSGGGGGSGGAASNTQTAITTTDPCQQKNAISANAATAEQAYENSQIFSNTLNTGTEYGVNQRLATWNATNNSYKSVNVTSGTSGAWQPTFTWNGVDGYTLGFSHGHPGGTGPSPDDFWSIFYPISSNDLTSAGSAAMQFYKNNASVTTETVTGNYIITIKDWAAISNYFSSSYSTPAKQQDFENNYISFGLDFENSHPDQPGNAGAYALLSMLPVNSINIFFAPAGTTAYLPIEIDSSGEFDTISTIPCP